MSKPVFSGLSFLDIRKVICMIMQNQSINCTRLCYTDTHNYKIQVKSEDVYVDLAEDFETKFNTSNYEVDRPLPIGKNKKMIGLIKNELGGRMKEFFALRPKMYSYLTGNG